MFDSHSESEGNFVYFQKLKRTLVLFFNNYYSLGYLILTASISLPRTFSSSPTF